MKQLLTCLTLICLYSASFGCDVCGGFSSSYSLMDINRKNAITLQYQYAQYQSNSRLNEKNTDKTQVLTWQGRLQIAPKLFINLSLPYIIKERAYSNETNYKLQGVGDFTGIVSYILHQKDIKDKGKIFTEGGLGIKLNNGAYDNSIIDMDLPKNYNIGNGSIGIPLYTRFIYSSLNKGLAAKLSYQHNFATYTGHKFGNLFNANVFYYREWKASNYVVLPQLGMSFDQFSKDHYPNKKTDDLSGGNLLNLTPGVQFKNNNYLIGLGTQIPLIQNFNNKNFSADAQFNIQLTYIF